MGQAQKAGKGGGARKYGRNKTSCARYRAENRRAANRTANLKREAKHRDKQRAKRARRDAAPAEA